MFNRMILNDLRRSFDRLFEDSRSSRAVGSEAPFAWTFTPAVETDWTEDHFNLRLIVPGVTEKDLKVTVQGNQLSIQGERKELDAEGSLRVTEVYMGVRKALGSNYQMKITLKGVRPPIWRRVQVPGTIRPREVPRGDSDSVWLDR